MQSVRVASTYGGAVVTISLHDPAKGNALSPNMIHELRHALAAVEADPNVRVVVLTGEGRYFCAGMRLDPKEVFRPKKDPLLKGTSPTDTFPTTLTTDTTTPTTTTPTTTWPQPGKNASASLRYSISKPPMKSSHENDSVIGAPVHPNKETPPVDPSDNLFVALRSLSKPTVAVLNGPALGGGVGLALACDVRIAVPHATFQLPETRWGLVPALISPVVASVLGPSRMHAASLLGATLSARELYEAGIVFKVQVDTGPALQEVIHALLLASPEALTATKRLLAGLRSPSNPEAVAQRAFKAMMRSPSAREGIQAFVEKRAPEWAVLEERMNENQPAITPPMIRATWKGDPGKRDSKL